MTPGRAAGRERAQVGRQDPVWNDAGAWPWRELAEAKATLGGSGHVTTASGSSFGPWFDTVSV